MGSDDTSDDPTRTSDGERRKGPPPEPLGEARFAPGTVLAERYRVVGLLGRGGMGEVYRAEDLKLRQTVALKLLPQRVAADPVRLARFHNEVRVARAVSHPNVCRVHDIGEADGLTFLSMEYVDGEDLASLLRRIGRFPTERALEVARQVCAGLAAAHDSGVLHRDLKPANVMIDGKGRARLTDFGLAVVADEARAPGEIAGTPAYMAPEQIAGGELSPLTDIYALGLVLYELFTGRAAFRADGMARMIEQQRTAVPPAPSTVVGDLDPRIERVILQCLEKDPRQRPASARIVAAALGGQDALAAVIAAGETPSPEMVAAAGEEGALSPARALGALLAIVAVFAIIVAFPRAAVLFDQIPFDKPPDVLVARARDLIRRAGYAEPPEAQAIGFAYDGRLIQYLERHDTSLSRWDRLSSGQPAAIFFWYRQSPAPLQTLHPFGRPDLNDPPPLSPGMVTVRLDTRGRLLELQARPPATGAAGTGPPATDWSELIASAGLDPARLQPTAPIRTPAAFADTRAAWTGVFPDRPELPLRVEAAACRGLPVAFQVLGPWEDEAGAPPARGSGVVAIGPGLVLVLPVLLGASLLLAQRNLRLGRGDRRGAFRLASFVFVCRMLAWALYARHDLPREWDLLEYGVARALLVAAWTWMMYVALEPYVRRRWPGALISWSRLLAGRFLDPLVGRDLLLGTLVAVTTAVLAALAHVGPTWLQRPPPRLMEVDLGHLLGLRHFLARLLLAPTLAVLFGMFMMLALLVLRLATRRPGAAAAGFVLLWTAVLAAGWGSTPIEVLAYGAMATLLVVTLSRLGLLAMIVSVFYGAIEIPLSSHLSAWYATSGILAILLVVGVAGFGAFAALGRRLPTGWLED